MLRSHLTSTTRYFWSWKFSGKFVLATCVSTCLTKIGTGASATNFYQVDLFSVSCFLCLSTSEPSSTNIFQKPLIADPWLLFPQFQEALGSSPTKPGIWVCLLSPWYTDKDLLLQKQGHSGHGTPTTVWSLILETAPAPASGSWKSMPSTVPCSGLHLLAMAAGGGNIVWKGPVRLQLIWRLNNGRMRKAGPKEAEYTWKFQYKSYQEK